MYGMTIKPVLLGPSWIIIGWQKAAFDAVNLVAELVGFPERRVIINAAEVEVSRHCDR
jgi:hypothetical protein